MHDVATTALGLPSGANTSTPSGGVAPGGRGVGGGPGQMMNGLSGPVRDTYTRPSSRTPTSWYITVTSARIGRSKKSTRRPSGV